MDVQESKQDGVPKYDHAYWNDELTSAQKRTRKWREKGNKIVDRFQGRTGPEEKVIFSLNLFNSNVTTIQSMLYGRMPQVDVSRRYADADDDKARVAAEILSRILNTDINDTEDSYTVSLKYALQDRLLPGLGIARLRYDFEEESEEVEEEMDGVLEMREEATLIDEWAPIEYVHWKDFLWGYAKIWGDVPWVAFRSYLTKAEMTSRFGKKKADAAEYIQTKTEKDNISQSNVEEHTTNTDVAPVWEIWCRSNEMVHWINKGMDHLLDEEEDPLELDGFFPCPMPMMANLTTDNTIPVADFVIAEDLYNEIDVLQTRIKILTKAVKAVGAYDKSNDGVKRIMQEGVDNDLIPVDNWAMFAEKGGLKGTIDWIPIDAVVNALIRLKEMRDDTISLLYQVTGLSDILRGASTEARISATEQSLKAKFASIRVQALQDEFARFASDLQRLKVEIISRHFDPQTIITQSNIMVTPDKEIVPSAIELIKQPELAQWRIEVRPESVAMVDYAQLKAERTEYLTALATFMQSSAPLIQQGGPAVAPVLLEMLKWGMAGFKGSQQIEGVLDKAISQLQKSLSQPDQGQKENPEQQKAQMAQQKAQADMMKQQQKAVQELQKMNTQLQIDLVRIKAELGADVQREKAQAYFNIMEKKVAPAGKAA